MKPKGLGKICYIISNLNEDNGFLIKLINYQAKRDIKISVIAKDEIFTNAQKSFSKKVNLYSASMQQTAQSRKVFISMLRIIKPNAVFAFEADINACLFADYAKTKIMQIKLGNNFGYKKHIFVSQEIDKASEFMIDFLEKKYALDFYPKHYIQSKTLFAQMKPYEIVDAFINRTKRVNAAFEKEWGYVLPAIPNTYNEKINHAKTLPAYKKYRKYVDKFRVRKHLHKKGYGNLLPEMFGFTKRKISKKLWDFLPDRFVIKPTNSSGFNLIIEDKSKYNRHVINRVIGYIKNIHYGLYKNEPVYSFWNDFLITEFIPDLTDYKFFCFDGRIEFVAVVNELKKENDNGEPYQAIVDKRFTELPFSFGYERGTHKYQKPSYFDKMVDIVEKLSAEFKHVRIDMMGDCDRFYFGEFTFFSGGGRDRFVPAEYDAFYGSIMK